MTVDQGEHNAVNGVFLQPLTNSAKILIFRGVSFLGPRDLNPRLMYLCKNGCKVSPVIASLCPIKLGENCQ